MAKKPLEITSNFLCHVEELDRGFLVMIEKMTSESQVPTEFIELLFCFYKPSASKQMKTFSLIY